MLSETKAIVIGGLGGIGSAICNSLLENKVQSLVIFDIHETLTDQFMNKSNVRYVKCSVESREELKVAFDSVWHSFNGFNLVVNSAGIVRESSPEKVFAINTVNCLPVIYMLNKGTKISTLIVRCYQFCLCCF